MRDLPSHLAIIGGATAVAAGVAAGWVAGLIVALIGLGVAASTWVGRRIATDVDRGWLTALLPLAFIAKMIGSAVRYFVVAGSFASWLISRLHGKLGLYDPAATANAHGISADQMQRVRVGRIDKGADRD